MPPLTGIRVVELAEGMAGPYAGKLLALMGADVVKVEPPGGDRARHTGALVGTAGPEDERRAPFLHVNTGKRSVVADVERPDDASMVRGLMAGAHLVLTSSPAGHLEQHGLGYEETARANPAVTFVSVTPFGLAGPYAGYKGAEIVNYALGGAMSSTGVASREPIKLGAELGQYQCGTLATLAALGGLGVAEASGRGVHVDLAQIDSQLVSIDRRMTYLLYYAYTGRDAPRSEGRRLGALPAGIKLAEDGHVWISTMPQWLPRMLKVLEAPELAPRYAAPDAITDMELAELTDVAVTTWGVMRTRQQAMDDAQRDGWPVTAVNTPADLLEDPHFRARGYWQSIDHPVAGKLTYPGPPVRWPDGGAPLGRAPLLDEQGEELRAEAGAQPPAPGAPRSGERRLPLEGVRVLDLTVVWAGPYATTLLGDLGAEIIRVDNPWVWPTSTRGLFPRPTPELVPILGPIFGGYPDMDAGKRPWNRVALFTAHARNKKSVTLALQRPLGRETFLRLAEQCDVLIENNSVDLLDKLGIGWDEVSARNPRLTMVRLPSVGLDGPYRNYLGFGVNFESLCGLTAIRGYPDADPAETDPVFHMDTASGAMGAVAVVAALRERDRTGRGSLVELSQCENMINHIGELVVEASATGVRHERLGNRHPERAPQGVYRCRDAAVGTAGAGGVGAHGTDRWVAISVGSDEEWAGLRTAMGEPDWAEDFRFTSAAGRREHHDAIDGGISAWAKELTHYEAFHRCQEHGVPAGPVLTESECYADPHLRARGLFRENGSPEIGTHEYAAHAFRWDGPPLAWGPIPVLGADNDEILRGVVGLSEEEYAALEQDGQLCGDYLGPDGQSL
ncbi:MAG TPA: CoA transferase [Acidimicrobiales bacterium]|nr:CoA transferase [Acidimicrobiales bacterium]